MKKIQDKELIALLDQGMKQKDIAAKHNMTEAGVSKRVSSLRNRKRLAPLNELTPKQQRFAVEVANGATATDAAMVAFDCTTRQSAKQVGKTLQGNPQIQKAIDVIMDTTPGMGTADLVERLRDHVYSEDPSISIKAVDMGLKLKDAYPAARIKNTNLNVEVKMVDLSKYLNK